jgi:uncharacterized membrane protein YidH (DUF202 family)
MIHHHLVLFISVLCLVGFGLLASGLLIYKTVFPSADGELGRSRTLWSLLLGAILVTIIVVTLLAFHMRSN